MVSPDIKILNFGNSNLWCLPELPIGLETLTCEGNNLTSLPPLPPTLKHLNCSNNSLTHLPVLPPTLISLMCSNNNLVELPKLPPNLKVRTQKRSNQIFQELIMKIYHPQNLDGLLFV